MANGHFEKHLELASEQAKERIREDRDRASEKVKPLLAHIKKHLFDGRLTATTLMQDCGVRDRTMSTTFSQELKATPAEYLRDRRMETAVLLLRDTNLKISTIGELVYNCDLGPFSHRFRRWAKMSPKKYRKAIRADPDSVRFSGRRTSAAPSLVVDCRKLERGLALAHWEDLRYLPAKMSPKKYRKAIRADPASVRFSGCPASASPSLVADCRKLERGLALAHWEDLRYLPAKKQLELVRKPYGITMPALFDVLREKSREEGRKDRQAGVRLAKLALASLDGITDYLTAEELANRKAQGTAWLGNALRLALDFPAAERAFPQARKVLPKRPEPQVLAEIYAFEGELLLSQSRFKEALELKNSVVEILQSLGDKEALAESLLSRATAVGCCSGFEAAIPDFLRAVELADSVQNPHLAACVHLGLVGAYALSEQPDKALQGLAAAREHCADLDDRVVACQFHWTEGLIAKQQGIPDRAEELLLKAHYGFAAAGETLFVATVDLDLAELHLERTRQSQAVRHALRAIPIFEHFGNHPEATAALSLLGDVAVKHRISIEVLQSLRGHLTHLGRIT